MDGRVGQALPVGAEGANSFERELVVRHAREVLEGQQLDMHIVALAGGLQKFEAELDHCENARRWRDAPRREAGMGSWFGSCIRSLLRRASWWKAGERETSSHSR
jgi:hypothetical protein